MMKWRKKGKIFDHNTFSLGWFEKNAMMPLPYVLSERVLRIFATFCDSENVGRIGYVDVDIDNPKLILGYSHEPIIDIGESGTYDDNGVVTGSIFENDDGLYLFYSGYQLGKKVPYMIFSGAALSHDKGESFEKLHKEVPMLDRLPGEKNFRCVPIIIQQGTIFKMWYLADSCKGLAWLRNKDGKLQPVYSERYMESDKLLQWEGTGEPVMDFASEDEHGLSIGSVWFERNKYRCVYSIRSISKGYRLGYAESEDGRRFQRMDGDLNLDVTPGAFDSDMMCYGKLLRMEGKTYLFYCGNHYGMEGIGYAELEE